MRRVRRPAGRWILLLVSILAAGLLLPVPAQAAPARPMDDDHPCRHKPDTIYIPRDKQGYAFNFYCREGGRHGIFRQDEAKVNGLDPGWFKNITPLKEWGDDNISANGTIMFEKLTMEPCRTFQIREEDDPDEWDLEYGQCAEIRQLSPGAGPCDQWKVLVKNLRDAGTAGVSAWDGFDDGMLSFCTVDNPLFQKAYRRPTNEDKNNYDLNDFSAPAQVAEPFGKILFVVVWVAEGVLVIGVMVVGARFMNARRNGFEEPTTGLLLLGVSAIVLGAGGAFFMAVVT